MHILVALDESRYAETIIRWMNVFPHAPGTRLTLVHVLEPFDVPEAVGSFGQDLVRKHRLASAEAFLEKGMRFLEASYQPVTAVVREGLPIYELLTCVRDTQPSLVVAGTRGLLAAKGFMLGSVSQRLLHYAPCSVLLVPAKVESAKRFKVLVATDGSPGAKEAAGLVAGLPDVGQVTVLSVVRLFDQGDSARQGLAAAESRKVRTEIIRGRRATARRAIEETAEIVQRAGAIVKTRLVSGHPAEAIPREAKRGRYDLLVVGSRGLTGMTAIAMGSISTAVAQSAPCPVLVVKPSDHTTQSSR
ncbi:MAG: universal stress protein [Nitrospiraceae bacterium]|nr:MAG: universal stress protein [Nitrospiraceae bacterium]